MEARIALDDQMIRFMSEFDWTVITVLLYLLCLTGVITAVLIRYVWRRQLLDRGSDPRLILGNSNLPVAYLSAMRGKPPALKIMWLSPNQFVVFASIHDRINNMRHGMCTDLVSWQQFALLAAAAGYRRLSSLTSDTADTDHDDDLVSKVVTAEMENIVEPYIVWIFRDFGSPQAELDRCRDNPKSLRGVPGRPVPSLADDIVNIVVH
nr:MAG: wsv021-like protein [Marsupenaeus japonicus pemonivirus]